MTQASARPSGADQAPLIEYVGKMVAYDGLRAVLPVPNHQRVNGWSRFWVLHQPFDFDPEKRELFGLGPVFRVIEVEDGAAHTDRLVTDDRPMSQWESLKGIFSLAAFLPVPDRQGVDGASEYWVFHIDPDGKLLFRKIRIKHDAAHTDTVVQEDYPASGWTSLSGVSQPVAFVPVPDQQRVGGASEYWLFHYDADWNLLCRKIQVKDGAHADTVLRKDYQPTDWASLSGIGQLATFIPVPDRQGVDGASELWALHFKPDLKLEYRKLQVKFGAAHTDTVLKKDESINEWLSFAKTQQQNSAAAAHVQQYMAWRAARKRGETPYYKRDEYSDWKIKKWLWRW